MKKQEQKALKEELVTVVKKQLLLNHTDITGKLEKTVKKSVKKIVSKARKKKITESLKPISIPKPVKKTKKVKQ